MTKQEFASRLQNACAAVTAAEQELTEIDSRFGDADHGLTMSKIAKAISAAAGESEGGIQAMLDDAAMAVMVLNGGSAVPLWNTWLDGLQEEAPEGEEIDVAGLKAIFAKALARAGAKVALLGRNMEKLKALADEIEAEGGIARGYTCNVMNKANCLQVAEDVMAELGSCDILVNGAGGNNARANTDKEYFEMADLEDDTVTFFDLDESGVEMVFDLNFIGTLLPTQAFARQMVGRPGCNILNISSMNAYLPLTKIPAYSGSKAAVTNFTQWLAVH